MSDRERDLALFLEQYLSGHCDEERVDSFLKMIEDDPSLFEGAYQNLVIDFLLKRAVGRSGSEGEESLGEAVVLPDFDHLADLVLLSPPLPKTTEEEGGPKIPVTAPKTRASREKGSFLPLTVLLALILCAFLPLIYFEWNPSKDHDADAGILEKNRAIAVLTNDADVVWAEGTLTPKPGVPLPVGSLRFESGTIELLFFNGVRSVIEGPADLTLLGEKQVFCRHGTWSVTVPPQGTGFEIQTPSLVVRDLGTEFFADIDAKESKVRVLKGKVEVENADGAKTHLTTGRGATFRQSLPVKVEATTPEPFVTRTEMQRRSNLQLFRSTTPPTPPETVRREAFRAIDFGRSGRSDATVFGDSIVDGSEPTLKAFQFTKQSDRIRLRPAGQLNAATFVVTLRVDRLNSQMNPILMTEGSQHGGLVWHILPTGQLVVGRRYQSARKSGISRTPIVVTPETIGRWTTFAWTLEGTAKRFTVYVDGDPVYLGTLPYAGSLNLDEIDVGSWKLKTGKADDNRPLEGAVQHFLLFDRILTHQEIRTVSTAVP